MRKETEQSHTRTLNKREFRRETIGRGYTPNKFFRRKLNAGIRTAQKEPDMNMEEVAAFLDAVNLD